MFNRSNIPKFKNLNKIEKIIFIISLLFTIISIILMVLYKIKVINNNGKNFGVNKIVVNNNEIENEINLEGSGNVYNVEVYL